MAITFFAKIALYPTLGYTLFMAQVSTRKLYHRIDDTVVLGALPFKWVLKELISKENVKGLVSLNEDFELSSLVHSQEELKDLGVDQLRIPTVDYVGTPSQGDIHKAVDFISTYRERKESVYVHCKAGRTRSATVVTCYLMQVNGWSPEEAVDFIKKRRNHVWLRDKQWDSIRTFYDNINNRAKT